MIQKLKALFSALLGAAARFPLPAIFAVICCTIFFLGTYDFFKDSKLYNLFFRDSDSKSNNLLNILTCVHGFPLFIAIQLLAESRKLSRIVLYSIGILILAIIAWYDLTASFSEMSLLQLGLVIAIFIAPFSARKTTGDQVVCFGYTLNINTIIAMIAYVVAILGGIAIISSDCYLFEIENDQFIARYNTIPTLALLFTVLAAIPRSFNKETIENGRIAKVLIYIFLPILFIYAIVLHAYIAKLLLAQSIPANLVTRMVLIFGIASIVTYLIAYTMRHQQIISSVIKHFPKLLLLPIILLGFAISIRISNYDFTENRYLIVLCAIWMAISTISMLWIQQAPKLILSTAVALLLLGSFGPWSINKLPLYSQTHRLEALLQKNHILVDGHIIKSKKAISKKDMSDIEDLVIYILSHDGVTLIKPWFPQATWDDRRPYHTVIEAIGIK